MDELETAEKWRADQSRCRQCEHLMSFHDDKGCRCWNLGIRAVPLFRCACVVSVRPEIKTSPNPTLTNLFINQSDQEYANHYNAPPIKFHPYVAKINPVPPHIGAQINSITYQNSINPEDVLSSLANTLASRDIWQDNDYTEVQRKQIIQLAIALQDTLRKTQGNQS